MNILINIKDALDEIEYRLSLRNFLGYKLTDFQYKTLIAEDDNQIVSYKRQNRQEGTSLALILKVLKSVVYDCDKNDIIIFSRNNASAKILKEKMLDIIYENDLESLIESRTWPYIKFKFGVKIRFISCYGFNPNKIREAIKGLNINQIIYVDDFLHINTVNSTEMFLDELLRINPKQIHLFIEGKENRSWN